jgi:hypothetical protein
VEEYRNQFEKLKSKMLIEGRQFSERDFVDVFLSGLQEEIKPFAMTFKPNTLEATLEYALYMKSVIDYQFRKLKGTTRFTPNTSSAH